MIPPTVIYGIVGPCGGLRYIGRSHRIERRERSHLSSPQASTAVGRWMREVRRRGETVRFITLDIVEWGGEYSGVVEHRWIAFARSRGADLLNVRPRPGCSRVHYLERAPRRQRERDRKGAA